jgi:cellulose synthase/poly-beta-1,6-N-acetylglucosamine synthase-like glycosyltransferase
MDHHPEAGGLGVKMIDGKGNFLPESKRGLPSPSVAFFKIFGLSALFPKSRLFGKYHLGFLDKNKTHQVDVLAGAFMLLRKATLDKIGLLDETFFMYGEDIDLSYRITRGGYKNYYFPEARIIHYKGESTSKSSINYVIVFYKAMIIFASKHFSQSNAKLFSFFISIAIYLRAGIAILNRFVKNITLPAIDAILFFTGMFLLKMYWESSVKELDYPPEFMMVVVPIYIFIWLISIFLSGGSLLEDLDRDVVGRADERHAAVARRAVDGYARLHQARAQRVDVVDLIGEMAEIAPARVALGVPIVGQLDEWRVAGLARLHVV